MLTNACGSIHQRHRDDGHVEIWFDAQPIVIQIVEDDVVMLRKDCSVLFFSMVCVCVCGWLVRLWRFWGVVAHGCVVVGLSLFGIKKKRKTWWFCRDACTRNEDWPHLRPSCAACRTSHSETASWCYSTPRSSGPCWLSFRWDSPPLIIFFWCGRCRVHTFFKKIIITTSGRAGGGRGGKEREN